MATQPLLLDAFLASGGLLKFRTLVLGYWLDEEPAKYPSPAAQNLPNRMPAGMEMMNQVIRISDSFIAIFLLLSRQGNRLKLRASA